MKELIKDFPFVKRIRESELSSSAAIHITLGILGILSARATVSAKLLPFGVSMLAAAPYGYLPSVAIGGFLGYFIPAIAGGGFRYVAALLAVLSIKLLLCDFKSVSNSPLFSCGISFLSLAVTAPVSGNGISPLLLAAETVLGAGAAYFFKTVLCALGKRKAGFLPDELVAFLVAVAVWTAGVSKINVFGIYFYRIICVLLVLTAAKYGGQIISAAAGICASLCVFLVSRDLPVCIIFILLGVVSGSFRIYGRIVTALVSVAAALVGMIITDNSLHTALLFETVIGAVIFTVIPKSIGTEIGKYLSVYPKITVQSDLKKMIKLKLTDAAAALSDVKNTVNEVSSRLSLITSPDFSEMISEIENTACAGCKYRVFCWETKRQSTVDAFMAVVEAKKKGEENAEQCSGEEFTARCQKRESFIKTALSVYERYEKTLAAENRAKEVREVVSEQFDGISLLLKETANDIYAAERFDKNAAEIAAASLKNLEIAAEEAVCKIDKYGRKYIMIKAAKNGETVVNKMQVMRSVSTALECDFSIPTVTETPKSVFITLAEAPRYKIETGCYQIAANGAAMCGDSYKFLGDGHGRFFMILSDGMGTGGAAAVDSALSSGLVARLIKSGINLDSSLKIINSSMLFKSTYESTATLDVACIDLFSGKVLIYKAGAAPSLIKHGGRTGSFSGKSLPIGILNDVHFEKAEIKLKNRDIVLMMSDGATGEGTEWIKRELENCGEISAQGLAETVALAARRRRSDSHEDDITVMAAILTANK